MSDLGAHYSDMIDLADELRTTWKEEGRQAPDPIQFAGGPWDNDEYQGRFPPKQLRRKGWDGFYRLEEAGFYQYYTVEDCPDCDGGYCMVQVSERRCPGIGGSREPVERERKCEECGGTGRVEIPDQ